MSWLTDTLVAHPEIAIFLALAAGFYVGRFSYRGLGLGAVTATLLVGVVIGALAQDIKIDNVVKQVFFLLFLFALGYKLGPQFFAGLKGSGAPQALFTLTVVVVAFATVLGVSAVLGDNPGLAAGLAAGGLTQSSIIGVGQDAIRGLSEDAATLQQWSDLVPVGYAVTYILGTVGAAIYCATVAPRLLGITDLPRASRELEERLGFHDVNPDVESAYLDVVRRCYVVEGDDMTGRTAHDLEVEHARRNDARIYIARIRRGGTVEDTAADTVIRPGDTVVVTARRADLLETGLDSSLRVAVVGINSGPGFISGLHQYGLGLFFRVGRDTDAARGRNAAGALRVQVRPGADPRNPRRRPDDHRRGGGGAGVGAQPCPVARLHRALRRRQCPAHRRRRGRRRAQSVDEAPCRGGARHMTVEHISRAAIAQLQVLSPFELKSELGKLAGEHEKRTAFQMLNAGRGNPNFIAPTPRDAFFTLGRFALDECRAHHQWDPELVGVPQENGIASRFRSWLGAHADEPGTDLLRRLLEYGVGDCGFDADAFVWELADSIIGDHYPEPDRMLRHTEQIVHRYLVRELCGDDPAVGRFELFAVEGGTAAMCYIFNTLLINRLLHRGDKIAIMVPIFTPYLETPSWTSTASRSCTSRRP